MANDYKKVFSWDRVMKKYAPFFLFILVIIIFGSRVELAYAKITNPYVVDEKLQVLFSDSIPVLTYYGLENYTQDYIGGYAHFTFTYTHSRCCFASYPPRLYITDVDPRTTLMPVVRSIGVVYHLLPIPIPPGHPTDWYTYDLQFDTNGYTVVVKQAGITEVVNEYRIIEGLVSSDWMSLANIYPTFGIPSVQSMAFTPVPIESSPASNHNPVIIIPGIMATELLDETILGLNKIIWPDIIKIALSPLDDFLDVLKMDTNGLPTSNNIIIRGVVRNLNDADYFSGLVTNLIQEGYKENIDLFLFSYDWRLDIESSKNNLKNKIDKIKTQTGSQKVDVISHSMGGLVLKAYLKEYGGNYIDRFIGIGTPHSGSSNAFKILMYGDNLGVSRFFDLIGINGERIKIISQNMLSVYQLLPTRSYFDLYSYYVSDLDDLDDNDVRGNLSYEQTKQFLKNTGRNTLLVDRADEFHQNIDSLDPADYGVETYNIVGCGVQTLGKVFVLNKETSEDVEYNISYINGDGTVPIKSAENILTFKTYYAKNAVHATMPSLTGVKELIASILSNDENFDISLYPNLADSVDGCTIPNGKIVSFHSPIDLHIYDQEGNHVGPDKNGDIENNIAGVTYDIIDGNKFTFLPDGKEYRIVGRAINVGTFNTRIGTMQDERVVETRYFNEVPLSTTTQITFTISQEVSNFISVDSDGNGTFESQVQATSILDALESQDISKPTTTLNIKGNKFFDGSYISSVQVRLLAVDDNSGILKTEYSLNGGLTWDKYKKQFVINTRGEVQLMYRSTDRAGNIESAKTAEINIIHPGNS